MTKVSDARIAPSQARSEKREHSLAERIGRLDEDEMAGVRQDHLLYACDPGFQLVRADRAGDEVVLARDHERRSVDARELGPEVEAREDLVVEEPKRVRVRNFAGELLEVGAFVIAVLREVEREFTEGEGRELLVRLELSGLFRF